jgi:ribonuclease HII
MRIFKIVIGCDACGCGSLIDSVVASAVWWDKNYNIKGLNDSKKLSFKQREEVFKRIENLKITFAIGCASATEIEELNIYNAERLAMKRAIDKVIEKKGIPDCVLIDGKGHIEKLQASQKWIVKGDAKISAIMVASVVAKVLRDRYIKKVIVENPQYEVYKWSTNIGYGTKQHLEAIKKYGITPLHRRTFEPIKSWLQKGVINGVER